MVLPTISPLRISERSSSDRLSVPNPRAHDLLDFVFHLFPFSLLLLLYFVSDPSGELTLQFCHRAWHQLSQLSEIVGGTSADYVDHITGIVDTLHVHPLELSHQNLL